jgi:transcriptional regulator with XRE-family HTH domain
MARNDDHQTYFRHWREHRKLTLVEVGEKIGISHGQLSRIERGQAPYSQPILEKLAGVYECEIVDLLIRDPAEPESIWSIWARAEAAERRQILTVAEALTRYKAS